MSNTEVGEDFLRFMHGTVYDQDHPENYIPPVEFRLDTVLGELRQVVDLNLSEEERNAIRERIEGEYAEKYKSLPARRKNRLFANAARVALLSFVATVHAPNLWYMANNAWDDFRGAECTYGADPYQEVSDDVLREKVTGIDFAINEAEFRNVAEEIDAAVSVGDVQAITDSFLGQFGAGYRINDLPNDYFGIWDQGENLGSTKTADLHLSKKATTTFLAGLGLVPRSFMETMQGETIYMAFEPSFRGESVTGSGEGVGFYMTTPEGYTTANSMILDGTSPPNIPDIFYHEINHAVATQQCVTPYQPHGADQFADNNPEDFSYSDNRNNWINAYDDGLVVSPYGASAYSEDVAEVGGQLLALGYGQDTSDVLRGKQDAVIARQSLIEPNIGYLYQYRARFGTDWIFAEDHVRKPCPELLVCEESN